MYILIWLSRNKFAVTFSLRLPPTGGGQAIATTLRVADSRVKRVVFWPSDAFAILALTTDHETDHLVSIWPPTNSGTLNTMRATGEACATFVNLC